MPAPLATLIRAERTRRDLTQQQLADRIGVSLRAVSNWERGATVTPRRIPTVGEALGIRITETTDGWVSAPLAPGIPGTQAVDTDGLDGGRITIYMREGFLVGRTADEVAEIVAAGRLAALRTARDIAGRTAS